MDKLDKQKAKRILSAWAALEVLSPQVFRKREDLVAGNKQLIASFDEGLPWENNAEVIPKGKTIYYQVVIGTLHFSHAIAAMMKQYPDTHADRQQVNGHAILAVVIVDEHGFLVKNAMSISSFAWGMAQVLKGKLEELSAWPQHEKLLLENLENVLTGKNSKDVDAPLTKKRIIEGFQYLVDTLNLTNEIARDTLFATRIYVQSTKSEQPQPLLLNSFYLHDLVKALELLGKNELPINLERYLGIRKPAERSNMLSYDALEEAVSPILTPPARWPSARKQPLVMLQQAAVNLSLSKLKDGGILAVNGPPGTGKSTLLRDVIAGVVTKRALAMSAFADPESAFISSGDKMKAGQGWLQLYELDSKLKGFEIVIASSNNKAVENVSAELPSLLAIKSDTDDLRYFKTISDSLFGYDSWGMIAAVLGNSSNRYRFNQTFWWDRDVGLSTYLAHVCGSPQLIDIHDPKTKKVTGQKKPKIVEECDPPRDRQEALVRWEDARAEFQSLYIESTSYLSDLERAREGFHYLDLYENDAEALLAVNIEIDEHDAVKPRRKLLSLKSDLAAWEAKNETLSKRKNRLHKAIQVRVNAASHVLDKTSKHKSHQELHQLSPWCGEEMQMLRDKLFISAMKLHKAFIDAAAKPLRHNLALFMQHLANPSSLNIKKNHILPDLWSSFFIVVPTISTTFASVQQMLGRLPSEALGWLLIDEAGQATPQSAVGAITRAKRAIVVGDPMQIEPVVQLPSHLTESIHRHFKVNPHFYNAPNSSIQTLADEASAYYAELESMTGTRQIGVPLLVHRRCTEPMFSISNAIAYERLMIQAKVPRDSLIRERLGESAWLNVTGYAEDKWCMEEGAKLMELLTILSRYPEAPDIYILTPFVMVAQRIRELILNRKILHYWGIHNEYAWLYERVGTVHTVQGREAEAIIFVLGAPMSDQQGARAWAGLKPNLLNVAVTRAKEAFYVIGNKALWQEAGVFKELASRLD